MSDTIETDKSDAEWREQLSPSVPGAAPRRGPSGPPPAPSTARSAPGHLPLRRLAQPLFQSDTKYDSGTGWPSFYAPIPGALETKTDFKMFVPRQRVPLLPLRRPSGAWCSTTAGSDRAAVTQQWGGPQLRARRGVATPQEPGRDTK